MGSLKSDTHADVAPDEADDGGDEDDDEDDGDDDASYLCGTAVDSSSYFERHCDSERARAAISSAQRLLLLGSPCKKTEIGR